MQMPITIKFEEAGVTWLVRRNIEGVFIEYRDAAHYGGPWSEASKTIGNASLRRSFRKKLMQACDDLDEAEYGLVDKEKTT